MSRSRYRIVENEYPYFLTCTIVGWLPIFSRPKTVQIIFHSWKYLRDQGRLDIFAYVILENHLHLIAKSPDLSKEIGDFKSFTARKIIDLLQERGERDVLDQLAWHKERFKVDRDYQLWQEGSHPGQIHTAEMFEQKLNDTHQNPVERGYVDLAVHWRYSSARDYAGFPGLFPVTMPQM